MVKKLAVLFILVGLVFSFGIASAQDTPANGEVWEAIGGMNVRICAGVECPITSAFPAGQQIVVLDTRQIGDDVWALTERGWSAVRYGGSDYMRSVEGADPNAVEMVAPASPAHIFPGQVLSNGIGYYYAEPLGPGQEFKLAVPEGGALTVICQYCSPGSVPEGWTADGTVTLIGIIGATPDGSTPEDRNATATITTSQAEVIGVAVFYGQGNNPLSYVAGMFAELQAATGSAPRGLSSLDGTVFESADATMLGAPYALNMRTGAMPVQVNDLFIPQGITGLGTENGGDAVGFVHYPNTGRTVRYPVGSGGFILGSCGNCEVTVNGTTVEAESDGSHGNLFLVLGSNVSGQAVSDVEFEVENYTAGHMGVVSIFGSTEDPYEGALNNMVNTTLGAPGCGAEGCLTATIYVFALDGDEVQVEQFDYAQGVVEPELVPSWLS